MMIKEAKKLSRNYLANPLQDSSFYSILKKKQAVDLRDNYYINDLGNGYGDIKPLDQNKRFL